MPKCPKCGRNLPRDAKYCPECAFQFGEALSSISKVTSAPPAAAEEPAQEKKRRPLHWLYSTPVRKYFLVPVIILFVIVFSTIAVMVLLQVEIQPAGFNFVDVDGSLAEGSYVVSFAIHDANGKVGPSHGYVIVKIYDSQDVLLVSKDYDARTSGFTNVVDPSSGSTMLGFAVTISASEIGAGHPAAYGMGDLQLTFLSFTGYSVTENGPIPIPGL